jgi:hypothetical protein
LPTSEFALVMIIVQVARVSLFTRSRHSVHSPAIVRIGPFVELM